MTVTVVGSIAFDAIKTPFGERERILGGAATHFSLAASFFTDVRVVGPVGDDFGDEQYAVLRDHGVNTEDIEHVEGGKTFFWAGEYEWDFNMAKTLDTQLNVFGDFQPKLSDGSKGAELLFLANIQPDLQRQVREQCTGAQVAGLDSMNSTSTQGNTSITLQFALEEMDRQSLFHPLTSIATPAIFHSVMLANAVEEGDLASLNPVDYAAEWKWDGIRVQLVHAGGETRLYSRTGDDISRSFPDIAEADHWYESAMPNTETQPLFNEARRLGMSVWPTMVTFRPRASGRRSMAPTLSR